MAIDPSVWIEIIAPLAATGAVGGFLAGLLGVGGGIIFVPALDSVFHHMHLADEASMHAAVGTSLALVALTSGAAALQHRAKTPLDGKILKSWSAFLVLGVAAGSVLAARVEGGALRQIFAAVVGGIALYMAWGRDPSDDAGEKPRRAGLAVQAPIVTAIGMLGALIGVGGAILTVPFMTWLGVPLRRAIGTGSALAPVIAVPAALGYAVSGWGEAGLPPLSAGYVCFLAMAVVAPASLFFSRLGVSASHNAPRLWLRRGFAVLLICVAVKMGLLS